MNECFLSGRLTKNPECKYTQNQLAIVRATLAVDRYVKNGESQTDFVSLTAFGGTAERLEKYTFKGSKIFVKGSIKTGSYEKNGQKVYTTDVIVQSFEFMDSKKQKSEEPLKIDEQMFSQIDEEIPF